MRRQPLSSADGTSRRATILDVATAANVSPATVSRVLTGRKPVSGELSERVRQAARQLGYQPNPAAQVLLRGQHESIGVVVPDLANPYFSEVLKGVTAGAARDDRQVLVVDSNEDAVEEHRGAIRLARWVDGLVLCSPRMPAALLREVADSGTPLVVVNRSIRDARLDRVLVDYHGGMRDLCDHLIDLGHQRVAYLQGPAEAWSEQQRQRALNAAGKRGLHVIGIPCGSGTADGYQATEAALECRPTAIMAFSDYVALGALTRLGELGISVPEEVSLTGFDDIPLAALAGNGLTTATVRKAEIGDLSWRLLHERLLKQRQPGTVTVPSHLVVRGTTARARNNP
jgi:LacI family transcriptional regulator